MSTASRDFDWNDDTIGRLRTLWAEGHATAEIGRRLGISKNAVVGKSHRLNLVARPSPIRRDGAKQPRVRRPRCPSLTELQPRTTPTPARDPPAPQSSTAPVQNVAPVVRASPVVRPVYVPRGKQPCCWPIGEPGRSSFRFCNVPNVEGKPYCPEHCSLAYPKWRTSQAAA
jgi:GcrA cell cycle regulator